MTRTSLNDGDDPKIHSKGEEVSIGSDPMKSPIAIKSILKKSSRDQLYCYTFLLSRGREKKTNSFCSLHSFIGMGFVK